MANRVGSPLVEQTSELYVDRYTRLGIRQVLLDNSDLLLGVIELRKDIVVLDMIGESVQCRMDVFTRNTESDETNRDSL